MATWQQFADSAPDLAAPVHARLTRAKAHVLATVRKDGSPRVSGSEIEFTEDGHHLRIGSMSDARKGADLKRDSRFALHANPGDGSMEGGDSKLSGIAVELPNEGSDLFELDIREVVHTTVEDNELVVRFWTPEGGVREARRK